MSCYSSRGNQGAQPSTSGQGKPRDKREVIECPNCSGKKLKMKLTVNYSEKVTLKELKNYGIKDSVIEIRDILGLFGIMGHLVRPVHY